MLIDSEGELRFPLVDNKKRILIISSKSLDALVSISCIIKNLMNNGNPNEIVIDIKFIQPLEINTIKTKKHDEIYVINIGINKLNQEVILDFIKNEKIMNWYDNHNEWKDIEDTRLIIDTSKSCIELTSDDPELAKLGKLIREGRLSENRELYMFDIALKSDKSDETIRYDILHFLLKNDAKIKKRIEKKARKFEKLLDNNHKLLDDSKLIDDILFIDARNIKSYDKNHLLAEAYGNAPYIMIFDIDQETNKPIITISANAKTDLMELFGLSNGNPFKISIPFKENHKKYIGAIIKT